MATEKSFEQIQAEMTEAAKKIVDMSTTQGDFIKQALDQRQRADQERIHKKLEEAERKIALVARIKGKTQDLLSALHVEEALKTHRDQVWMRGKVSPLNYQRRLFDTEIQSAGFKITAFVPVWTPEVRHETVEEEYTPNERSSPRRRFVTRKSQTGRYYLDETESSLAVEVVTADFFKHNPKQFMTPDGLSIYRNGDCYSTYHEEQRYEEQIKGQPFIVLYGDDPAKFNFARSFTPPELGFMGIGNLLRAETRERYMQGKLPLQVEQKSLQFERDYIVRTGKPLVDFRKQG